MRPGRHAAGDGSFGRSAGTQTLRGAVLLAVAVLIGILLLNTAPNESGTVSTPSSKATKTTLPKLPAAGTATTAPSTTAALRSPAQVAVLVLNGTKVTGAATRIKSQLLQSGYNTVGAGNASTSDATTTTVNYTSGYQAEAAALATTLSLPTTAAQPMPSPPPTSDIKGANLVVVVGSDLASQLSSSTGTATTAPPATAAPTTSARTATTAARSTTTLRHATTSTTR